MSSPLAASTWMQGPAGTVAQRLRAADASTSGVGPESSDAEFCEAHSRIRAMMEDTGAATVAGDTAPSVEIARYLPRQLPSTSGKHGGLFAISIYHIVADLASRVCS
jgi:hypothetical protein